MHIIRVELDQDIVQCPYCGAIYIATNLEGGERFQCTSCGQPFTPSKHLLAEQL